LAAGNPLLLEQVAFNITKGKGIPEISGDSASIEAGLLRSRFTGISVDESRYAQAASVLGIRFRPAMAAALAELAPDAGDRALEALCRGGLFKADGPTRSRFTHPMLRKVVYEDIPAPVRSSWHTRAFRLLVVSGADPSEAAEHASRADLAGDAEAVAILAEAGRAAMRAGAIARARQRLTTAVQLAGTVASPQLLMELGEVLLVGGDGRAAAITYRRALALPELPRSIRTEAQRMLGRALFIRGAVQDAAEAFREAVSSALPDDRTNAVEALLDQAFTAWPTGGPSMARPLLERARDLATDASTSLRIRTDTAWAFSAFVGGDPSGIPVVDGAVKHAFANPEADTADFAWSWGTLGTYGNLAKWTERFDDATRAYGVGIKAAERMGLPVAIAAVTVMHADTCVRTGQLRLALELADRATLLADLAPERAFWAAITHAYVLADMGHMEECAAWSRRASELADPDDGWAGRVWLWHVEAVLAMHGRQTEQACALFDRVCELASRLEIVEPCVVPWAGDAIAAYLYGGRVGDALAIIESLEGLAKRLPCRLPRIVVAGSRAALARGDNGLTQSLLEEQLGLAHEAGLPVIEARVGTRLGGFLRRVGQDRQARPYLARAVQLAESCGAESVASKAREELRLAGGRQTRPRQDPDALTFAEERVRRLAVQGLSPKQIADQLFVTINTIDTHLQHIYRKLGINSWRELIALSRRQDEPPAPSGAPEQP
jgi:DNA-binding CsgD family transcriptional regulator